MVTWKIVFLYQSVVFRVHVSFRECICSVQHPTVGRDVQGERETEPRPGRQPDHLTDETLFKPRAHRANTCSVCATGAFVLSWAKKHL